MPELTLETSLRLLQERGFKSADGTAYTCPHCKIGRLAVGLNGSGPTFSCPSGCNVTAWLQTVADLPVPRGPNIDLLEKLRGDLGLPELVKIVKHGRLGSSYNFHLDDGRIVVIGGVATLTAWPKFRAAFLPQVRRNPPRYKVNDWDLITEQIEQAAEERDAVATLAEETMSWIAGAIHEGRVKRSVNVENAETMFEILAPGVNGRPPFFDTDGRLHLRLEHVIQWLGRIASIRITQPELSARLSELDFERVQHQARHGGELRKARYWASAPGFEDRT